jgi:hypothetical protein
MLVLLGLHPASCLAPEIGLLGSARVVFRVFEADR